MGREAFPEVGLFQRTGEGRTLCGLRAAGNLRNGGPRLLSNDAITTCLRLSKSEGLAAPPPHARSIIKVIREVWLTVPGPTLFHMQESTSPGKSHQHRVCPWWFGYLLLGPIRRLRHDPSAILAPYLHKGMTVLEPGPGMGFFTLELARRVGRTGRVIAIDVQPKMIERLKRRAANAHLADRIDARVTRADSMQLDGLDRGIGVPAVRTLGGYHKFAPASSS